MTGAMPQPDPLRPAPRRPRFPPDMRDMLSPYLGTPGPGPRDPRKRGEPEREPVEPDKPNLLSGGAAAPLEFDD